jgi:hypothetical protein
MCANPAQSGALFVQTAMDPTEITDPTLAEARMPTIPFSDEQLEDLAVTSNTAAIRPSGDETFHLVDCSGLLQEVDTRTICAKTQYLYSEEVDFYQLDNAEAQFSLVPRKVGKYLVFKYTAVCDCGDHDGSEFQGWLVLLQADVVEDRTANDCANSSSNGLYPSECNCGSGLDMRLCLCEDNGYCQKCLESKSECRCESKSFLGQRLA